MADESLSLLHPQSSDERIVLGEWTHLKYLSYERLEEERMAVVRAVDVNNLWDGFNVEKDFPPFTRFHGEQVVDYLHLHAPMDNLVIAHDPYDFETPGAPWLAFNPAVAQALGWRPIDSGWFSWEDQESNPVVESIWWCDGPMHQFNYHFNLSVEVGSGWLVLVTERGYEEIKRWAEHLNRGGVVGRSSKLHGASGPNYAVSVIPIV